MNEKLYEVALTLTPGIGNSLIKTLISYCGSAEAVFQTPKGKLGKIPGVGQITSDSISRNKETLSKAANILKRVEKEGIKLYFYTDSDYPTRLKQLYDAPALIYLKGTELAEERRMLSIVGTRQITTLGKEYVNEFVADLVPYQPIIISGLAYGVDIEAHKSAIQHSLPTYGVMATGIDRIYPGIHQKIATQMQDNGGILTEYPPETKMDPARFPARNRIIAGLSDATLVVEAGAKGGALITAHLARDYDREVFVIPGDLNKTYSEGCNYLIKNNVAQLVTSAKDIAYFLGWENEKFINKTKRPVIKKEDVTEEEWSVIQLLNGNEVHIDELSWKSQIQVSKLATILLNLEFENIVVSLPGKKFKLK